MKHIFYLIAIIGLFTPCMMSAQQLYWVVQMQDGSEYAEALSAIDDVSFADKKMYVKAQSTETYELPTVRKIYFTHAPSAISAVKNGKEDLVVYPNPATDYIMIKHLSEPVVASIYTMDGTLVKSLVIAPDEKCDVSSLSKGVYVIRVNNNAYLFGKQ